MRNFLLGLLNRFEYFDVPIREVTKRENTKNHLAKHPSLQCE